MMPTRLMTRELTALVFLAASLGAAEKPFVSLFDGKSLKGWKQCNGQATYKVEGGAIVGTTKEGSPNSFLCSEKEYGDFVLEFEVKVDPELNSGVQIRSHQYPQAVNNHPAGRVYGYQVEISNEKSGASGGIYDEARRGWLDNIDKNPVASKALKDNQWNKYRVEAMGDRIKVFINGIPCADLTDPVDMTGFIGLQVHSFEGAKPAQVRWRGIRIQDLGRHVWKPIWDGSSMAGWLHQGGGRFTVEDGAIHGQSLEGDARIGFVVTEQTWADVTARVQFKIARGNSGFFLRSEKGTMKGYEVELDAVKRTGGFWEVGGRNWVEGPEDNAAVKAGEWNEMTASLHGHRIAFHVNGVRTYFNPNDSAGKTEAGVLGLQAHGAKNPTEVWFKGMEVLVPAQ